jgi:hypothetical protein
MANNVGNLNSFACQALPHRIIPLHAPLSPFSSSSRHSECRVSRHRFTSSYGTGKGERGQAKKGNVRMRVTQMYNRQSLKRQTILLEISSAHRAGSINATCTYQDPQLSTKSTQIGATWVGTQHFPKKQVMGGFYPTSSV